LSCPHNKGELHGSFVAIDEVQGLYIARDKAKQNFRLPEVSKLEEQSVTHALLFKGATISGQWKVLLSVSVA
jgi:hypothetical protein